MGARYPCVEMTDGRLHAMAAARSLLEALPYKLESGLDALKNAGTYDHNKNSLGAEAGKDTSRIPVPSSSTSHLQPFTAPWLAEVARITPARPEHLPFVHPSSPSGHAAPAIPDYYPHFSNMQQTRASYYNHSMFTNPHPYLRDFQPRSPIRPYPLINQRQHSDTQLPRSPPNPSQAIPHIRPLGPPPPPPPVSDIREAARNEHHHMTSESGGSHRTSHGEPSPKRRHTSFQFSSSSSHHTARTSQKYHNKQQSHRHIHSPDSHRNRKSPNNRPIFDETQISGPSTSTISGTSHQRESPGNSTTVTASGSSLPGSYYPHFQKGALVAIGNEVRRVEDMRTEDFVEAASAAEDLTLDPPSVSSIVMASSGHSATVTFNFPSRNTEVSSLPVYHSKYMSS